MKNRGFIYIFTLVIISLLALAFYFIYSSSVNGSLIARVRLNKIQADYMAESAINIVTANKNFKDEIENKYYEMDGHEKFWNPTLTENLKDTQINNLQGKIMKGGKFNISSDVTYKKLNSKMILEGTFINEFYLERDGILNSKKGEAKDFLEFLSSFEKLKNGQVEGAKIIITRSDYVVGTRNGRPAIFEEFEGPKGRKEIIKSYLEPGVILYIKEGSIKLEKSPTFLDNPIILNGVLKGDKLIMEGFLFIDREGLLQSKTKVDGYLIDIFDRAGDISVKYRQENLKKYGKILPDYIKIKAGRLIKNN